MAPVTAAAMVTTAAAVAPVGVTAAASVAPVAAVAYKLDIRLTGAGAFLIEDVEGG
jgi:hypothetical protein